MSVFRPNAVRMQDGAPTGDRRRTLLTASAAALVVLGVAAPQGSALATTSTSVPLSTLTPVSATNGYGPYERDRSNGEQAPGDGRRITVNGQGFDNGLGVHAGSELRYTVPAGCHWFWSTVGVDDEVGTRGSVVFQVFQGSSKLFDSGRRTGSSANATASVRVTAGATLRLVVTNAGDGSSHDHADWAGANFSCTIADPAPTTTTSPAPTTTTSPAPTTTSPLLVETFDGADGTFVSQNDFWSSTDLGLSKNATWLAESGTMLRSGGTGRTSSDYFRMWTRSNDLAHVSADVDVTFNGFTSGTAGWHGINLWLHKQMCTPVPSCSAINDPSSKAGNSGYALDFMNRDGGLTILKKVSGDTRAQWPASNIGFVEGGTYYYLAGSTFRPTVGQRYRFSGRTVDNGDGSTTLQILVDGRLLLQVRDDGKVGGPRLGAGRVGLRSDFAHMTVDDFTITR